MNASLVCYDCLTVVQTDWENCTSCGTMRPHGGWGLDPLIGLVLSDRYKVESRLGEGGMGTVYRAHRTGSLGGEVAVKVLSPQLSRTVIARRFEREAKVVSELSSPHIVRIYDFETFTYPVDGSPLFYIAMELIKGMPLSKIMRSASSPVNFMWGIEVLRQAARGLDEAHSRGIVHRDLKPANVMIVSERRATHVKLLDFGIAAITDDGTEEVEKLTKTGIVTGTPDYMAPEQAMGGEIGPAADMYSLGVMAFHMFSGKLPFTGPTAMAVLTKRVTEDAPFLRDMEGGDLIPEPIHALVEKLLQRVPDQRYQDAGELLDDLAQFPVVQVAPDVVPDEAMITQFTQNITSPSLTGRQSSKTVANQSRGAVAPAATEVANTGGGRGWVMALVALLVLGGGGFATYWFGFRDDGSAKKPAPPTKTAKTAKAAKGTAGKANATSDPAPAGDRPSSRGRRGIATSPEPATKTTRPVGKPATTATDKPAIKALSLFMQAARPALPAGYETVGTSNLADGRVLSVALPTPRPALHVPLKSLVQVDKGSRGLNLSSASVTLSLQGNALGTGKMAAARSDGRLQVAWPPLPMAASYQVTVAYVLADGTEGRLSMRYDASSGKLATQ